MEGKSNLHWTTLFKLLKVGKTMPLLKQLRLISNGKTINTHELLPLNGQPQIQAVKTNSMHELTSSKSAARQVAYFTQRATNTMLSSYKSTHGLPTTCPFTCPLLLLYRKSSIVASTTNLAGFKLMINRLRKQEQIRKATFQFTFHSTTTCKQRNNTSSKLKPTTLTQN